MPSLSPEKKVQVSIEDTMLPSFKSLRLHQSINDHHAFEVLLDNEIGEMPQTHSLNKSASWLGKKLSIYLGEKQFVGVIVQVGLQRVDGASFLRVSGYSTTYLLESDAHFASWNEKTLEAIVGELTEKAGVQARIKPEKTSKLEYECQYQESNFGFIQRLAKQHFEWLYFDGLNLVFGKPELEVPVELDTQRDLQALDICVQTGVRALSAYSHQSGANNTLNASSPDEPTGLNNLGSQAFDASIELFGTPSNHYALARTTSKSDLDTYLKKKQQADAAMSHYVTAESSYIGLMLGSVVEIKSAIKILSNTFIEEGIGTYFITEMTHYANGDENSYHSHFVGVSSSVKTLPTPNVPLPIAQPQMATVISNDDPKKQGRVQVKMNWQVNGMKSPWIRVLSPDAGGCDKVASNRGFVFIPEEGDQVMVAFRYNDPNRPYIQGSLFNGTNAGGGGQGNSTKSLTTRSGATISLDDSKGSITVKDPSGNTILLGGDNTITITAVDSLTLNAKNISINGSSSVDIRGEAVDMTANALSVKGKTTKINGSESLELTSPKIISMGSSKVEVQAKEIETSSSGTTTLTASILKLNS